MSGSIAGARRRTTGRAARARASVESELAYLAGAGVLEPGTRNWVWQCWHLTILPRTSSGTTSSLRHLRLGQISWTAIVRRLQCIIGQRIESLELRHAEACPTREAAGLGISTV